MTNKAKDKIDKALNAIGEIIDTAHQAKGDAKRHAKKVREAGSLLGEALDELFKPDEEVEVTIKKE